MSSREIKQVQYQKDYTALKHFLIGRKFSNALIALGFASKIHSGVRKDKVTPEFHHQIRVCFNFQNIPITLSVKDEEDCYTALLLHDTVEDTETTYDDLRKVGIRESSIILITGMTKIPNQESSAYYENMLSHGLIPILKGCDRDHNLNSMHSAFSSEKMEKYLIETSKYILPMIKKASYLFPGYTQACKAISSGLKKQIEIYEVLIQHKKLAEQFEVLERAHVYALSKLDELKNELSAYAPKSSLQDIQNDLDVIKNNSKVTSRKVYFGPSGDYN